MTIDEAIEREKFKARIDRIKANKRIFYNNDKDEINACNRSAEEHEQIAEWLEELKIYRESSYGELHDMIYNKAIDDFVEEIKDDFVISHDVRVAEMKAKQMKNNKE